VGSALALCLVSTPAHAGSGGAGLTDQKPGGKAPAKSATRAQVADIRCIANPTGGCVDSHRADRGGAISLTGRSLALSAQVVFYGSKGVRDDVLVPIQSATDTRVLASVPPAARNGPIAVIEATGSRSPRWEGLIIESPEEGLGALHPASPITPIQIAVSEPHRIFFGGMQKAIFNFRVTGGAPMDVEVDLARMSDGAIVRRWQRRHVLPDVLQRVVWNGAARGRAQPAGRYGFRITTPTAVGASAPPASPSPTGADAVTLVDHMFPIRGAHQYGMGAGRFGAPRRGHVHQGQDVFAACGTPLVAARGGRVVYSGYHSLAGYYVVIDGEGTGIDSAYMHLREPALVTAGSHVYTGQPLGEVGDTGDAQGCHLHFEEWTAPGWYKGGRPFDPLSDLKRWDQSS
jgi:hypothetical protein